MESAVRPLVTQRQQRETVGLCVVDTLLASCAGPLIRRTSTPPPPQMMTERKQPGACLLMIADAKPCSLPLTVQPAALQSAHLAEHRNVPVCELVASEELARARLLHIRHTGTPGRTQVQCHLPLLTSARTGAHTKTRRLQAAPSSGQPCCRLEVCCCQAGTSHLHAA